MRILNTFLQILDNILRSAFLETKKREKIQQKSGLDFYEGQIRTNNF